MAGYRHRRGDESLADRRAARRRASLAQRLARAASPGDRVAAAADFVRGAIAHAPAEQADQAADRAVAVMRDLGERLLTDTGTEATK